MLEIVLYIASLAAFFAIFNILGFGLNIQFGYAGILDFSYITFMACGAYVSGVFTLGPASPALDQEYVLGLSLPFPVAMFAAAVVAGLLGLLVGLVALNRLRSDYLAIAMVVIGTISYDVVGNFRSLFNGWSGIVGVPQPFNGVLNLDPNTYLLFYVGFCAAVMVVLWIIAARLYQSQLGRTWRAIREDLDVAESFGKNTFVLRLEAMVIGCIYAGIAGSLTIGLIGALAPAGWTIAETFGLWTALLIGGRGNNWGVVLGVFLVLILFNEATRFLPPIPDHPSLISAVRGMIVGALLVAALWFRPLGLIPERRKRFYELPITFQQVKEIPVAP